MTRVIIRIRLEQYQEWRRTFDDLGTYRKSSGSKGCEILRHSKDPNELVLVWNWIDLHSAKEYFGRSSWRDLMKISGVAKTPEINYYDSIENVDV